jgi:hypothetical protein
MPKREIVETGCQRDRLLHAAVTSAESTNDRTFCTTVEITRYGGISRELPRRTALYPNNAVGSFKPAVVYQFRGTCSAKSVCHGAGVTANAVAKTEITNFRDMVILPFGTPHSKEPVEHSTAIGQST